MILEKYSMGIGDRFAHQGKAQLQALITARENNINVVPVWNKSNREHSTIKTTPADVRQEADNAVNDLEWENSYYVDADHIGIKNVDPFIEPSNFFTIDVADYISTAPSSKCSMENDISAFIDKYKKYAGTLSIPNIDSSFEIGSKQIELIARKFLPAIKEAGKIYRYIENIKGIDNFITEISMDETNEPQTPVEMFFILVAIADEKIPAQTIAPKFTGRFNKGVDYVGDTTQFDKEFNECIAVTEFAINEFSLPKNLKLSIHSGSDKFSIYEHINKAIKKYNTGLHLKTAGTTWLEELIGLAMANGEGLQIAKEIYEKAFDRFDELVGPYSTVIDIDKNRLPLPHTVSEWSGDQYANTLRHDLSSDLYSPDFRQILHVSYKIAAEMGTRYLNTLNEFEEIIAQNVTENIYERHIRKIFS